MFRAAQAWLVYELTGSPLFLGYAAAANAAPGIFFNLFGGVFADRLNKRLLVMTTQAANAGLICLLAVLTILGLVQVLQDWIDGVGMSSIVGVNMSDSGGVPGELIGLLGLPKITPFVQF